MRKPIEYFYNWVFYELVVFFQMRWIISPLLKFGNKIHKDRNNQSKKTKHLDVQSFFSPNDYAITLRGTELFVGIGICPIGLFLTRNIHSAVLSIFFIILISLLPIFILDYLFLTKDNKFVNYYRQFEQSTRRVKTKWAFISILFIVILTVVFILNWIFWERY